MLDPNDKMRLDVITLKAQYKEWQERKDNITKGQLIDLVEVLWPSLIYMTEAVINRNAREADFLEALENLKDIS